MRARLGFVRHPAVGAFVVLAVVLVACVLLVSAGRALDPVQYLGLIAAALGTAAAAVLLVYAGSGSES